MQGDPAVSFGSDTYTAAEGDSVTVTVNLSAAPTSAVTIPITAANQGGASNSDYSVPPSVTFATTETSKTFTFTATDDVDNDRGESVLLGFGTLPVRVNEGEPSKSTVNITDNYCTNHAIWCATLDLWEGTSPGAQRLYLNLSRASTKRTSGAAECCITWMMPDGFGLAGGRPGWWGSWSRRGESVKGVDKTYHCGGGMLYHLGDA